jgi:NADH-quinone oxidoreductase E subunit
MSVEEQACSGNCERQKQQRMDAILERHRGQQGALIPILQEVQGIYKYLPKEALKYVAEQTGTPIAQIYGVVTFYSQFHLEPRGRNIVRVCQGTACHVRGGKQILQAMEKKLNVKAGHTTEDQCFTLETVACLGACGLAPVMQVNGDTHGRLTPDKLSAILVKYE